MRSKILAQLDDEKAQQALKKLETAKTPSEILELAFDAAELGAQMMIKFDKKRAISSSVSLSKPNGNYSILYRTTAYTTYGRDDCIWSGYGHTDSLPG